jgi:hypothetical protein
MKKNFNLALLAVVLLLSSCQKEQVKPTETAPGNAVKSARTAGYAITDRVYMMYDGYPELTGPAVGGILTHNPTVPWGTDTHGNISYGWSIGEANAFIAMSGYLYAVHAGHLWQINPNTSLQPWPTGVVDMGSDWGGTEAMTHNGVEIFGVQGGVLWGFNPSNRAGRYIGGDWGGTEGMVFHRSPGATTGFIYAVHQGTLYRTATSNGYSISLGGGWSGTKAMTAHNGNLYIIQGGTLWRRNIATGATTALASGTWAANAMDMVYHQNYLYVTFNQGPSLSDYGVVLRVDLNGIRPENHFIARGYYELAAF